MKNFELGKKWLFENCSNYNIEPMLFHQGYIMSKSDTTTIFHFYYKSQSCIVSEYQIWNFLSGILSLDDESILSLIEEFFNEHNLLPPKEVECSLFF